MDEAFINSVRKTLLKHLEDDKFGVAELSREIGLSKSQILRKIKSSTGKTANEYIRLTRLNEAASMLKDGNFTVSEISYRVGFGSPSYFNKCFHDYFGITPGEYKSADHKQIELSRKQSNRVFSKNPKSIGFLLFVVISFLLLFWFFSYFFSAESNSERKSYAVAVMPFDNLSNDSSKVYISEGITETIINQFTNYKSLRVVGPESTKKFKQEPVSYGEIAKRLQVNLILKGSILFSGDSIRIITRLIEPLPQEKLIWHNFYDLELDQLLYMVDKISSHIAKEINLSLKIEKANTYYQVNPEALDYYLRGRHLQKKQNPKSVKLAIDHLRKSIAIDSNYAPSYVVLAEAYVSLNKMIQNEDQKRNNVTLARKAIDKGLSMGPYLAEAYITKGITLEKFDWDWEGMYAMTMKGLELDPNNSYAHTQLSKYYLYTNQMEKSIQEALIAEKLDPFNARASTIVGERYFYNRQWEKSLDQFYKVIELHPEHAFGWDGLGYVQFETGQEEEAINSYLKFQKIMNNKSMIAQLESDTTFEESIYFWLDKSTKKAPMYCSHPAVIGQAFLFVGDNENALNYLEVAYAQRDQDLPSMLLKPLFEPLYKEPRFLDLLDKTGVSISNSLAQ